MITSTNGGQVGNCFLTANQLRRSHQDTGQVHLDYMGETFQATTRFHKSSISQKAIKTALRCMFSVNSHLPGFNSHLSGFKLSPDPIHVIMCCQNRRIR